jgi:serine/threonine protein kinase
MSPEQVMGDRAADARSDIYSTGVVLYEIVTGRPPFIGENGFAVMCGHQSAAPIPPVDLEPAAGAALSGVILKALEKNPAQRYQTAAEFEEAIEHALLPVRPGRRRGTLGQVVGDPRQRPLILLGGISVSVCAAAFFVTVFSSAPAAISPEQRYPSRPLVFERPKPVSELAPVAEPAPVPLTESAPARDAAPPAAPRAMRKPKAADPGLPSPLLGITITPMEDPQPAIEPSPRANPPLVPGEERSNIRIAPPEMASPGPDPGAVAPPPELGEAPDTPAPKKPHVVWRTLRKVLHLPKGAEPAPSQPARPR